MLVQYEVKWIENSKEQYERGILSASTWNEAVERLHEYYGKEIYWFAFCEQYPTLSESEVKELW